MPEPLVSVIIAAYNRADYVQETIDSVLSQDYPNLEVVVIDDGSSDNTGEVLAAYGEQIRHFHQANMGETRTVNRGLALATGDILSVLSSDDLFLPGAVKSAVDALREHPTAIATYCDWLWIDENGLVLQFWQTADHDLREVLRQTDCIPGPGAFFRRETLDKLPGRNPGLRVVADFDFWLRLALYGDLIRVPGYFSAFREHQGSISVAGHSLAMATETVAMVRDYFEQTNLPDAIRAVRRQAIGSANFLAGCRSGGNLAAKVAFFARAFPWISNYRRARIPLELLQGWAWARAIKQFLIGRIRQHPDVGRHYLELAYPIETR